jgi:hypothetical protein
MNIHAIQTGAVQVKEESSRWQRLWNRAFVECSVRQGMGGTTRIDPYKVAGGVSPDTNLAIHTMQKILNFASQRPTVYLPTHDPNSEKRLKNKTILLIG